MKDHDGGRGGARTPSRAGAIGRNVVHADLEVPGRLDARRPGVTWPARDAPARYDGSTPRPVTGAPSSDPAAAARW
jgi:hypothetical protein